MMITEVFQDTKKTEGKTLSKKHEKGALDLDRLDGQDQAQQQIASRRRRFVCISHKRSSELIIFVLYIANFKILGFAGLTCKKQVPYELDPIHTVFSFLSFRESQPASTDLPTACFVEIQPAPAFFARLLREQKPCWPGKECLHPFRRTTVQDAPTPWSRPCLAGGRGP